MNIMIKCACGCGTEFFKYDLQGRSRKYIKGHNLKIISSKVKPENKKGSLIKRCENCNVEFGKKSYVSLVKKQRFCSSECFNEFTNKDKQKLLKCSFCGKEIKIKKSFVEKFKNHYCNRDCMANHYREILKENKNPNYDNRWSDKQKSNLSEKMNGKINIGLEKVDEIYSLWKLGITDKEISRRLKISTPTIKKFRLKKGLKANGDFCSFDAEQRRNFQKYGVGFSWKRVNCISPHFTKETLKHLSAKCAISIVLLEKGYTFFTEVPTDKGIIDVYDFTNKNIYEMESKLTESKKQEKINQLFNDEYMNDIFVFDLRKLPDDLKGMADYFMEKVI